MRCIILGISFNIVIIETIPYLGTSNLSAKSVPLALPRDARLNVEALGLKKACFDPVQ